MQEINCIAIYIECTDYNETRTDNSGQKSLFCNIILFIFFFTNMQSNITKVNLFHDKPDDQNTVLSFMGLRYARFNFGKIVDFYKNLY